MNITLGRLAALHTATALKTHIRQLRRDGCAVPPELAGLVDELLAGVTRTVTQERARALSAARNRRYRARKRQRQAA